MTVKELREELKTYPQDIDVYVQDVKGEATLIFKRKIWEMGIGECIGLGAIALMFLLGSIAMISSIGEDNWSDDF